MTTRDLCPRFRVGSVTILPCLLLMCASAQAATTLFFQSSQSTNLVASGTTSDTLGSQGYLFTYTRDKLFTGGVGMTNPIGRFVRVFWPDGLEAQAVTTGPAPTGAEIMITRQDKQPFDIQSFRMKLLANTAGAGASIEIMPMLDGQDGFPDPLALDATGYGGSQFSYTTPSLTGFDSYKFALYVDFAITQMTIFDNSPPPPTLSVSRLGPGLVEVSWPASAAGYVLESADALPARNWTRITTAPTASADLLKVQQAPGASQRLYRLRK